MVTSKFYPSRSSSKMIAKNEPFELISESALHLPTKFGEDRPKDLEEVGEQTEKNINLTFDLDDLDLSKNESLKLISGAVLHLAFKFGEDRPKDLGGTNRKKNNINLTFDLDDLWPNWIHKS